MDMVQYHCKVHGLVGERARAEFLASDDFLTCPVKDHPNEAPCGRYLSFGFAPTKR
jgi:hypothetical protein